MSTALTILIIASGIAVLIEAIKVAIEKNKISWHFYITLVITLVIIYSSLYNENHKAIEESSRFSSNIDRLDSLIKKANTSSLKLDSNLNYSDSILLKSIENNKNSKLNIELTKTINDSLNRSISYQLKLFDTSKSIIKKTTELLLATNEITLFNTKLKSPFLPCNIRIVFSIPIVANTQLAQLKDSILLLVSKINNKLIPKNINIITSNNYIQVNNYPLLFPIVNSKYFKNTNIGINFITDTLSGKSSLLILTGLKNESPFLNNEGINIRPSKYNLYVDLNSNSITFDWYLTNYRIENSNKPELVGVNDLIGKYLYVFLGEKETKAKLNTIIFYTYFNNNFKRLLINPSYPNKVLKNDNNSLYVQTINEESILWLKDDYQEIYH